MNKFFIKIYDFLFARRGLTFSILLILVAVCLILVFSLKYNENIFDFLPVSGNDQKAISLYQDISGGQRIVTMFKIKDGSKEGIEHLTEAVDSFADMLSSGSEGQNISELTTQVDMERISNISDFIYQNIPLMLTDSDYQYMEDLISKPDYASEQLSNDLQMILMPATGVFSSIITRDPLGLFTPVIDRLQSRQSSLPMDIDDGYIYTSDHKYAIAMLTSPYGATESAKNAKLVSYIDSVREETMAQFDDVEIYSTGSPVIAVGNASQIKQDSQWAISIAITLILLLLLLSFRNVKNLILIGLSIVFGWIFAMALIAAIRNDVSLIVIGIGSVIIGIAVNYPLHFIAHISHGETMHDVLKEMIAPLLIGNITTVGAFASLMPLDAPALRDLGLFAAFMLIGTILFVLVFLPHLVKRRKIQEQERLLFGKFTRKSFENRPWMVWVIVVLTIVLGYYSLDTSFDANMHHINYMTDTQTRLLSELHASAGVNDTSNVYLVAEGRSWDEALSHRTEMSHLLDSLKEKSIIKSYSDATSLICSEQEQQRKLDKWNEFWNVHRDSICASLETAATKFDFNQDAFNEFYDIISADYTVHQFDYFEPIKSVLLGNAFSKANGQFSVVDIIDVGDSDVEEVESILNNCSSGYAFDFAGMNSSVARSLSDDFNYIGFACGFIVFIFLWLSFGRLELSILAFLPMALGWIWILGIMTLCGIQFNIVNVILATFIFGQGDDYTIFMTDGLIEEYAYKKKLLPSFKNSIVISALIMFIGMGSLIVARHPALHSLAEVTIVGMLTVVVMAWIVPSIVFNWLVSTAGHIRLTPITTEQILRAIVGGSVYLFELTYGALFGLISRIPIGNSKIREDWFHRMIYNSMRFNAKYIFGVKHYVTNEYGEDFCRGSIMICNHQSILDPLYMLMLHPRVLILVSNKVWKNPVVHTMFKLSRFISMAQDNEDMKEDIRKAVNDGYNVVIFPEGKRTNGTLSRFHKGAFHIALEIGADVLPIYLHGAGHILPKSSGFAAKGRVDIIIGKRVRNSELHNLNTSNSKQLTTSEAQSIANYFRHTYEYQLNEIRKQIEDTHYFHHYIIYKYIYKGIGIERETRMLLKKYNDFSKWIDGYVAQNESSKEVSIINAGRGQFSLLFALVHPEMIIRSYSSEQDDIKLLNSIQPMPKNLEVIDTEYSQTKEMTNSNIIDLSDIIQL